MPGPEIFAHRAAPVQISYLGYPGTLGATFMDYMIANSVSHSGAAACPLCREDDFPAARAYGDRQHKTDRRKSHHPPRHKSAEPGSSFAASTIATRFLPPISISGCGCCSRSIAVCCGWPASTTRQAQPWQKKPASAASIPAGWLFPRSPQCPTISPARVWPTFLDTSNYTGHATAADALWAGLPVLTLFLPGRGFHTRVAASLLTAIGLPDLIAQTPEEYERLALELARDPDRLAALKQRLRENRAHMPLFDTGALHQKYRNRLPAGLPALVRRRAGGGHFRGRPGPFS